ncbi:hypothetical protein Tco_0814680 [Tanacetum coccineum]
MSTRSFSSPRRPRMNRLKTLKEVKSHIFSGKHAKVLNASWDKLLEIKHAQSEDVQDLINKLVEDVQKINEDLADYVNCPGFNRELVSSYDDDDGDILFLETLLYDNSSPRPPKAVQTNYDEINLFTGSEDSIPPGIENDDFDSEDDDNSALFPEFKSFHVDYPKSGNSTNDVVEIRHIKSMRILTTLSPVIDKVFNHDVLASKEKSTPSSSHRDLKASKLFHHENPLLIHGDNTPSLSVCHPHFYPP